MSFEKPYVRIDTKTGEATRTALLNAGLLDSEFKIVQEDETLYLPLVSMPPKKELKRILGKAKFETGTREFNFVRAIPKTLSEALTGLVSPDLLEYLPRAYDLVGDIAVLEIPDELLDYRRQIGIAFQSMHKNFATVLGKRGAISGTARVRKYDLLAGQNKTRTVHTEYGCKIAVDLEKAYFSPRLLEEHHRVSELVSDDEMVVDMFAGVGPFAIHIARKRRAKVIAIDINPDATDLLRESMTLNRFVGRILPITGDAHEYVVNTFSQDVDRVIMNHPSGAFEFVKDACHALKDGGVMHYYDFMSGDDPEGSLEKKITELVEAGGRSIERIDLIRRVRDSAPREYQMVADVVIQ
ncbi:MAG: class I SAM-dependent methyltransferase family protein [Candidatus Hodarchaeota archaeon]